MKRLILPALIALFSSPAFAAGYGDAGCGLGSMVFGSSPGAVQILAMTTNATFYSQLFGITSGTSNCGGLGAGGDVVHAYVQANREVLAKDAARGSGDTIVALSLISGCESPEAVGTHLQSRYAEVFAAEASSSYDLTQSILQSLRSNDSLSCQKLLS